MIIEHIAHCHICGSSSLDVFNGYSDFCQVTSDCRPWHPGGSISICRVCCTVQKVISPNWQRDTQEIYEKYAIYSQAAGEEQRIFDQTTGEAKSRSVYLVDKLLSSSTFSATGRLLDIGCGNGAFLRAFSDVVHGWQLAGFEVGDKHRGEIESIPHVEALYVGQLEDVPGDFDVICLIHVLEHIPDPISFINTIKQKLRPGGLLVIEVPNLSDNPFDLLIIDHCTHFTNSTLRQVVESSDLAVLSATSSWIPKELSFLTGVSNGEISPPGLKSSEHSQCEDAELATRHLNWLRSFLGKAKSVDGKPFGVFGTSIVGAWLWAEHGEKIDFFVDEDASRFGELFFGKAILPPDEIPEGASVYLGLMPATASKVYERLANSKFELILPPPYDSL